MIEIMALIIFMILGFAGLLWAILSIVVWIEERNL